MTRVLNNRNIDSIDAANLLQTDPADVIGHPVELFDDTLRDGEQTVGVTFTVEQKIELARMMMDAGLRLFSAGYAAVSEQEREAARAIIALGGPAKELYGFARATRGDMEVAMSCGFKGVGMFIPISDSHLHYKMEMDEDTAYKRAVESVQLARSYGLQVRFGFEDATRAPMERIKRFTGGVIEAGANQVTIADTVGILTPLTTYSVVKQLTTFMGSVPLMVHFHDDLGMATANSLVATVAGARLITGTSCGLGERAGNCCLEEVAVALRVKYGVDCGVDLRKLVALARRVSELAGFPIAPNKPILGRNVFSHETGIHVHGLMRERSTYEPFPPEIIGAEHQIHFGKHSGLSSMEYLAAFNGIEASREAMTEALGVIKDMASSGRAPSSAEAAAVLAKAVERARTRQGAA